MSEIKIEKGIPLPNRDARSKYPFRDMKIGDSIGFESVTDARRCHVSATSFGKRHNMKFRQAGNRVWRIE